MRGAMIHGVLLAVMLVYGYRTWTRDKSVEPNVGEVVLWDKSDADLVSVEFTSERKIVKLERRGQGGEAYWWGTDTTIEKKAKPPEPKKPDPGAGSGSAGSGAGSGSAGAGSGSAAKADGSGAGSAVAAGSGSAAKPANAGSAGSGSAVAAGSAAPKPDEPKKDDTAKGSGAGSGSGSAVASAGSGSAGTGSAGSGSAVAAGSGSAVAAAGSGSAGSGSAGSGSVASAGSAAPPAEKPVEEEIRKTHEFPLGETGDKLIKRYVSARALRDLGPPSDKDKKDFKLVDTKSSVVITFKDGKHTFALGGPVYGGSDKYALDAETGRAYVLSKDMLTALEIGESSLHLVEPRGFDITKIDAVKIDAGGRTKGVARISTAGADGQTVKSWGDAATKKADLTVANFVDNAAQLKPTEYAPTVKVADLKLVVKLTYADDGGSTLGTLTLYRREKAPDSKAVDPTMPPKLETEYFIMTEQTRVPALVRKDAAQRTEQDIPVVFGDRPPDPKPVPVDPKNNPFNPRTSPGPGGFPTPPPHGADPHGH